MVTMHEISNLIPERVARALKVVPLRLSDGILEVGSLARENPILRDELQFITGFKINLIELREDEISRRIASLYLPSPEGVLSLLESFDEEKRDSIGDSYLELSAMESMANDAPVVKLVNALIAEAVDMQASDIHIEPFEDELRVRFRIDGILYPRPSPPRRLAAAIASRIKIMAELDIAEKRLPQDGSIRTMVAGKEIDIRVSTGPSISGESLVLRILNRESLFFGLDDLGFFPDTLEKFESLIKSPHGIILVTGPTGSGKTTTLYAALNRLNSPQVKIITIEDPVEYQLKGIIQLPVNVRAGFTFATGLRSILRHDPDIIMVGEIRDKETLQIAIQAALTGHLVFATLHTNDAPSALTRLLDMGAEEFLVASTLRGVLAQRLIRRICPSCRGEGCPGCSDIGYRGRIGIYELLRVDQRIEELILKRSSSSKIREKAIEGGMKTLLEDGMTKVEHGITTKEEVLRVIQT